jgi:hypothetical protein
MLKGLFGKKTQPIPKVKLMGMNERALNLFTMFLNSSAKGLCEIVDDGSHHIVIIDLDAVENTRLWLDMRRQFPGPAIVLSVREQSLANAFWVAKPVKEEQFRLAFESAKKALSQVSSAPAATSRPPEPPRPSITPPKEESAQSGVPAVGVVRAASQKAAAATSDAAAGMSEGMEERGQNCCGDMTEDVYLDVTRRAELFGDWAQSMAGIFREAMRLTKDGGIVQLMGIGSHPFYVGAADNFVSTTMPESFLRSVCVRSSDSTQVKLVFVDKTPTEIGESEDRRLRRTDNMLWKLALWGSRGRVPRGTSLDAPVRLRAWPNIPRLMTVPHSLRIAALWVSQPTSLFETARKLNVPHRYVFSFFCACQAFDLIELLGSTTTHSGSDHAPKAMTQEKRGLFGSLLKKLGF